MKTTASDMGFRRSPSCSYAYCERGNFIYRRFACWVEISALPKKGIKEIFIKNFTCLKTQRNQSLLVKIINQITPCKVVTINKEKYIKYKLLKYYNNNLVLLNFIRNLWYSPRIGLSSYFFKVLRKLHKYFPDADPLEKLTRANKITCGKYHIFYQEHHSNCNSKSDLKLKTKCQLKKIARSTRGFLCNKQSARLTIKEKDVKDLF